MNKKRLCFGVLVPTLDQPMQNLVYRGIYKYANENDISIITYFGTYQTSYDGTNQASTAGINHFETCFESIRNSNIDGLILFSGFIYSYVAHDDFFRFINEIPKRIKVVSLLFLIPGIHSVLIENTIGIYNAVSHLICTHGKRKIAYINGPEGHFEADARFEGYRKALIDNGIDFDSNYVLPGNFNKISGCDAVKEILDVKKLDIDALAACDDETAIGAMAELKRRNISVPSDISVVGFDDDDDSSIHEPTISTVRQDFTCLGKAGIEVLHSIVTGKTADPVTYVAPIFIRRQSCGCYKKQIINIDLKNDEELIEADTFQSFVMLNILPVFHDEVPPEQARKWISTLVESIENMSFSSEVFLSTLNEHLKEFTIYSDRFDLWIDILGKLELGIVRFIDFKSIKHILQTIIIAIKLVQEVRIKNMYIRISKSDKMQLLIRRITGVIISTTDIDVLIEEIRRSCVMLSINTAIVGLYNTKINNTDKITPRLISSLYGFDGDKIFKEKYGNDNLINLSNLAKINDFEFDRDKRNLFYIPLFFNEYESGVLIISYNPELPFETYEMMRISISYSLNNAEQLLVYRSLSITDELTGLYNRRGFFQLAESRLLYVIREQEKISTIPIVLVMDLDELKKINDTYGHDEGDTAIIVFSKILKMSLRKGDIISRIGGDEFLVLSSVNSPENCILTENRIRTAFDNYNAQNLHPYKIEVSIGSIILESATLDCLEEAILNADKVLYEEKKEKKEKKKLLFK